MLSLRFTLSRRGGLAKPYGFTTNHPKTGKDDAKTGMRSDSKCSEFKAELDSAADPAKNCIGNQLINTLADASEASCSKADRLHA